MKIYGDKNPDAQPHAEKREYIRFKSFSELASGDKFKALIKDIGPSAVTLMLEDKTSLTARSMTLPDARIGDEAVFVVKDNSKGRIFLEMLRPESETHHGGIVRESLEAAYLPVNKETAALAAALIDRKLSIDPATLAKAAYFKFSDKLTIENVMFLIEEDFPAEPKTINALKLFLGGEKSLDADLKQIFAELEKASPEIKSEFARFFELSGKNELIEAKRQYIENILREPPDVSALKKASGELIKSLISDVEREPLEPERVLRELAGFAKAAKSAFTEGRQECPAAERLLDKLDFTAKIANYKEYIQIPFVFGDKAAEVELHIFKKARNEKIKESASILLALDMPFLGHVELFINKKGKGLDINLSAEDDGALRLVSQHSPKLGELLAAKGYRVNRFSASKSQRRRDISHSPISEKRLEPQRYTLDMRV